MKKIKIITGITLQDANGTVKKYTDFIQTDVSSNEAVLNFDEGCVYVKKVGGVINAYAVTQKVKKSVIQFKLGGKNATVLKHNESVVDYLDSGNETNPKNGKSTYFLPIKTDGGYYNLFNVLPCKFLSYYEFTKKSESYYVDFVTEFPETFEGEYKSETVAFTTAETRDALIEFTKQENNNYEEPFGWSTWDYYYTDINEDCIKENVEFLKNDAVLSKKIKYVSIDDGWEQSEGFWKEGAGFPSGLTKTAKYINDNGFVAGIWTCPIRFNTLCPTIMRRNEFLLKDEYGDPVLFDGSYVLDPTHPDGEKFIRETFTYLYSCGFRYFKIDFLSYILSCTRFYDKHAGHFDALRRLLETIRECVGNSHIMGCNMPYGVGYGYVDSRRVGLDIHNTYGHIQKCMEIYLPQFACQGNIYQNDLDYLVVRGDETANDEKHNVLNPTAEYWKAHKADKFVWRKGNDFSYNEAKMWCTVLLTSGSSIFLGDRLSKLNEKGLNLIYKVLENADFTYSKPLDIFESPLPSVWVKQNNVSVFNFSEDDKTFEIPNVNGEKYIDIFTNKEYKADDGKLTVNLKGHDSVYLKLEI